MLKRCETVWAMVYKLRRAMGERDERNTLQGMVEADEGYFGVEAIEEEQPRRLVRGSNTKSTVMVMAESTVLEDIETGEVDRQAEYFKSAVLPDNKSANTDMTLKKAIECDKSVVFSDNSTSYVNIAEYVDLHISEKSSEQTTKETLKRVHIAIGNAKRNVAGIYHKIKAKCLQLYLNEFVYKLNRRYFGARIFDRLFIASITATRHQTDMQ